MSIFTRGEEAKKALENQGGGGGLLDSDKGFIRLRVGDSRKVRILSKVDYVAYKAHGHFKNGIFTQPCIAPAGERCLLCEASSYDGELVGKRIGTVENMKGESVSEWNSMYAKKRVLFAFVDLEEDMIRVFDATKTQAEGLIQTIDEYGDDLSDMAFTLKRTGERLDTTYSLNPIMPKKMAEVQEAFDKYDGKEVPDELFSEALHARTTDDQAKELQKSGFPVEEVFGITVDLSDGGSDVVADTKDVSDEDLPF